MAAQDSRLEIVSRLPEDLRFVYDPDSPLPTAEHLRLVADHVTADFIGTVSMGYLGGFIQSPMVVRHTMAVGVTSRGQRISQPDVQRLEKFRFMRQQLSLGIESTHLLGAQALALLPEGLQRDQLRWLLATAERTSGMWRVHYIPSEVIEAEGIDEVNSFTVMHRATSEDDKGGVSVHAEDTPLQFDAAGSITSFGRTTEWYHAPDSAEANEYDHRFQVLGRVALPFEASMTRFEQVLAGEASL